jgi:hypothetical protein
LKNDAINQLPELGDDWERCLGAMTMSEKLLVLCQLQSKIPAGTVLPPAAKFLNCCICSRKVLASPSTQAMVAAGLCRPVCPEDLPNHDGYVPVVHDDFPKEFNEFDRAQAERN